MSYECLSRALAYVSCLFTMSLFTTSMALAAAEAGFIAPMHGPPVLTAQAAKAKAQPASSSVKVQAVAEAAMPKKT